MLVKQYSEHAKQSGIPEIKTALSGLVIKRFMGAWTLVIKSLGLVSTFNNIFPTHNLRCRVSVCSFWAVARERGSPSARCMLLCQHLPESITDSQQQRRYASYRSTKPLPGPDFALARKREILSAAAAAGISVAFGSPVGGVLFSLEVV